MDSINNLIVTGVPRSFERSLSGPKWMHANDPFFYLQPISPLLAPFLLCVGLVHIILKKFILISAFDLVLDPFLVGIDSVGSNGPLFISYLAVLTCFAADCMELNLTIPMCCSWAILVAFWVVFMNPIFKFAQMLIELASSAQYMGF